MQSFLRIEDHPLSLVQMVETLRGDERMPIGFLPIGIDTFGNLACLAVTGEDVGKVYFWDHEEDEEDEMFIELAADFSAFCETFFD